MLIYVKYNLEDDEIKYNSFEKIRNYNYILYVDCSNNKLTSLPKLPNSLQILLCNNNQLTSLPELPNSLQLLSCLNNKFIKKGKCKYLKQIIYL